MPIFEFSCQGCGLGFELLVRGQDAPSCPGCGDTALTRTISSFAVSSASTRAQTLQSARRQALPRLQEQRAAERESLHHDHDDH